MGRNYVGLGHFNGAVHCGRPEESCKHPFFSAWIYVAVLKRLEPFSQIKCGGCCYQASGTVQERSLPAPFESLR